MKIFTIFASICAVLIALVFFVAAVSPSEYTVKKEIIIHKNKNDVFAYIKLLKNQESYSAWAEMDPNIKRTYQGIDGEVGFIVTWQSDYQHIGKGEQEILKIIPGQRIETEKRFFEPFDTIDTTYMVVEPLSANETKLIRGLEGKMSLPMNLLLLVMDIDKELGVPLTSELENIKSLLEKPN